MKLFSSSRHDATSAACPALPIVERNTPCLQSFPNLSAAYLDGSNAHDAVACVACFAPDAVVMDEGRERRGTEDIRAWKEEVIAKYHALVDVIGVTADDKARRFVVTGRVSGNFPGSPVDLRYGFTLDGEKIARLEIVP